jgi:hypothetical protein
MSTINAASEVGIPGGNCGVKYLVKSKPDDLVKKSPN